MKKLRFGKNNSNWRGGIRKRKDGYILEYCPNHPFASLGAVLQHRLVWEKFYKIILPPDIIIHHKNGNPSDNRIENLEAITQSEHAKQHFDRSLKGKQYRRPLDGKDIYCLICNKRFYISKGKIGRVKYCSQKCSGLGRIKPKNIEVRLTCNFCHKEFMGKKRRMFCSSKCTNKLKRNGIIKNCAICSKEIYVTPCNKKRVVCSTVCQYIKINKHIKKICVFCKKDFLARYSAVRIGRGKFCSLSCHWHNIWKIKKLGKFPVIMKTIKKPS